MVNQKWAWREACDQEGGGQGRIFRIFLANQYTIYIDMMYIGDLN